MQPAAEAMKDALADAAIGRPRAPVVANVTAAAVSDPEEIRRLLTLQVMGAVRWRESVVFMARAGVTKFVECGAGKVLAGLLKRIVPGVSGISVGAPSDLAAYRAFIESVSSELGAGSR
jgi:[acyl-carrier-protein] S-malonyltransferase